MKKREYDCTSMYDPYCWYCPADGLEHRMLSIVGWREEHRLTVDGKEWVKLWKNTKGDISCLN